MKKVEPAKGKKSPILPKGFEQSKYDNDKGVKEGSAADMKRDVKEAKQMKKDMVPKGKPKGLEVKIEAKPMSKDDMAKREKQIRESVGSPRPDIMPMKRKY
jgi:hypothetical protein